MIFGTDESINSILIEVDKGTIDLEYSLAFMCKSSAFANLSMRSFQTLQFAQSSHLTFQRFEPMYLCSIRTPRESRPDSIFFDVDRFVQPFQIEKLEHSPVTVTDRGTVQRSSHGHWQSEVQFSGN